MSAKAEKKRPGGGLFGAVRFVMAAAMLLLAAVMLLPPGLFGMDSIEPEPLMVQLSAHSPPKVLDVRTTPEFNGGHIIGAVLLPLHKLPFNLSKMEAGKGQQVVLICMSGHRSRIAGLILRLAGYDRVINLTGGMAAWRAAGLPEAPAL